jgi:hypothetical protein
MIHVKIIDSEAKVVHGATPQKDKSGKETGEKRPYCFANQRAFAVIAPGVTLPFVLRLPKSRVNETDKTAEAYPEGNYIMPASALYTDRYGKLHISVGIDLQAVPSSAAKQAQAA